MGILEENYARAPTGISEQSPGNFTKEFLVETMVVFIEEFWKKILEWVEFPKEPGNHSRRYFLGGIMEANAEGSIEEFSK